MAGALGFGGPCVVREGGVIIGVEAGEGDEEEVADRAAEEPFVGAALARSKQRRGEPARKSEQKKGFRRSSG